ncbi:MAG: HAMP domain-containing histidine kinase [Rhodospirillaceae bacterium]|nr:HAMP domain-containing histidine kinase [Rhodospirillaceae bacterium]
MSAGLIVLAVVVAEAAYALLCAAHGVSFGREMAIGGGTVTLIVVTPIIVLAQIVIGQLGTSRRALRRLTERLAVAVDAAERANFAKTQFLANMSHELRTPLNAIIGFSELIQAQKLGPLGHERYLEYVKDIGRSGHHLLRIINDILDLAKIEAGRVDIRDEEEFKLGAVIDATLRMVRPLAERQGVTIDLSDDLGDMRLVAAERMVCQILLNLFSNALKFTPAGGHVQVSAARTADGGVIIAVRDTGVGMAPHEVEIALSPFGQVDNALARNHKGTGLGLPLAKAMMELHGGTLGVRSAPGKGTTVTLEFPATRVVSHPGNTAAEGAAAPAVPAQAKRIA